MKVEGLQHSALFGPVQSRRYGVSLGINLLPPDHKICSFDCPYCECGSTDRARSDCPPGVTYPDADAVLDALTAFLEKVRDEGRPLDAITLAGNGEPTLHPHFHEIMEGLADRRDVLAPRARLIVLTNGFSLGDSAIRDGLMIADERIVKIDAGTDDMFRRLNRPVCEMAVDDLIAGMKALPSFTSQTMFIAAPIDNTAPDHLEAWMDVMDTVRPSLAQIYSIDRRPADPSVQAVERETLEAIARRLMDRTGVPVQIY